MAESFIVYTTDLETGERVAYGSPWLSADLAYKFAEYASRMSRGKRRFWSEYQSTWKPAAPPARPVLADDETFLRMDV